MRQPVRLAYVKMLPILLLFGLDSIPLEDPDESTADSSDSLAEHDRSALQQLRIRSANQSRLAMLTCRSHQMTPRQKMCLSTQLVQALVQRLMAVSVIKTTIASLHRSSSSHMPT